MALAEMVRTHERSVTVEGMKARLERFKPYIEQSPTHTVEWAHLDTEGKPVTQVIDTHLMYGLTRAISRMEQPELLTETDVLAESPVKIIVFDPKALVIDDM